MIKDQSAQGKCPVGIRQIPGAFKSTPETDKSSLIFDDSGKLLSTGGQEVNKDPA
jgi:hypothetical protein